MLNPKSYSQLLKSLRLSQSFAPYFLTSDSKSQKTRVNSLKKETPVKRERPSQQIIKKLAEKSEKILGQTANAQKNKLKAPQEEKSTKDKRFSDIIKVKESQKGAKYKSLAEKGKKEVDPQTVYYNLRKKQYENPLRQEKYFKEHQETKLLNEKEIQDKLYATSTVEQVLRLYHGYKFNFSTRNLVTTVHRLGKFLPIEHKSHRKENLKLKVKKAFPYKHKEKRIQSLLFTLEESRKVLEPGDKMIIIWALTRMKYDEFDVYVKFTEDLFESLSKLKSDHLSLLAWCISHNGSRNPTLYGMISLELEKRFKKWKENKCFMTKEAYIQENNIPSRKENEKLVKEEYVESSEEELFPEIEEFEENKTAEEEIEEAKALMTEELLSAHGVSLVLWSFCKRNVLDENLFGSLEELFLRDVNLFNGQQIMNILFAFSVYKEKLTNQELSIIKKRLNEIDLAQEESLTMKTLIILLNKLGVEEEELYKKYIEEFIEQNKKRISPRWNCEILRVLTERKIFEEKFFAHLNNFIVKSIRHFNLEDCLSSFESLIKVHKMKGNALMKDSNYSIRTTLDIIVTKMMSFGPDITNKQKSILKKVLSEGKYQNKDLDKLFA